MDKERIRVIMAESGLPNNDLLMNALIRVVNETHEERGEYFRLDYEGLVEDKGDG